MNPLAIFYVIVLAIAIAIAYLIYREPKKGIKLDLGFEDLDSSGRVKSEKRTKKKTSPISGTCGLCEEKVHLPFKCKFCEGLYCAEHRLPENHDCEGL